MRPLLLVAVVASLAGCHGRTCAPPTFASSSANYPLVHVQANGTSGLPAGDIGYIVTANGQGGYRFAWTDTLDTAACFSGIITVQGTLDTAQTHGLSGAEELRFSNAGQLRFASVPGSALDGVDLVSSSESVYLDAYIDGSLSVNIYFADPASGVIGTTGVNPVAFQSP